MRNTWLITGAALAGLFVAGCGQNPQTTENPPPPPAVPSVPGGPPMPGAPPSTVATAKEGNLVYQANCLGCHGADGKGKMPDQPDFTDAAWQARHTEEELLVAIRDGHEKMPAFKDKLSEEQMKDVVAYVRTFAPPAE